MKRFLKSSLSLILSVTFIFSSVYVGLREVDFDKGAINSKFNNSNFDIHSVYNWFGELDFSSNLAIKAEAADYSDLTPNEYMTRVLLNYKYSGYLNDYGASDITYQNQLLKDYYYFPDEVSSARRFYYEFQNDNDFKSTVTLYKLLSLDLGDAASEAMKLEDYYTAILLNIIDAKLEDDNYLDSLTCEANKNLVELSKSVFDILEEFHNPGTVLVSSLSTSQIQSISNTIAKSSNHESLYKLTGKNISVISDFLLGCTSVNEALKNICVYTSIADTTVALENVLYEIYLNCPSTNVALKTASYQVYKYVSDEMGYAALTMMSAGESAIEAGIKVALSTVWENCITAIWGSYPALGLKLAQVVGKGIGNFCCGTDKILEQLVVIGCLVDFEDVMISAVKAIENDYKNSWTVSNADNYIKAVEMLLATYDLDCQYSNDFITLVYTGGVVTSIKYSKSETLQTWQNAFQKKRANIRWELIRFPDYAIYFEKDAPSGYDNYFGNGGQNNGDDDSFVPQYITLNKRSLELAVNMSTTLTATISPVNPNHRDTIIYYSSDDSVVSVDVNKGIITAVSPGTATITAIGVTVSGSIRTTCSVTVFPFTLSENDTGYTIDRCADFFKEISVPSELDGINITSIANKAFTECVNLTSITIPDTVDSIGETFADCVNLAEINIDADNKNYSSEDGVFFNKNQTTLIRYPKNKADAEYIIPSNVKKVAQCAFSECKKLTSLIIPEGVADIGLSAFVGCEKLEQVKYNAKNCNIDTIIEVLNQVFRCSPFNNCAKLSYVQIGSSVEVLPPDIFYSNTNLTDVVFEENSNLQRIEDSAFRTCKTLTSIEIPDSVTSIGEAAFWGCDSLTSVIIPKKVTSLGNYAFENCDNLTSVTIPESLTQIGGGAFEYCDNLESVYISDIGKWCAIDFSSPETNPLYYADNLYLNEELVTDIVIPESVSSISEYTFVGLPNLKSIIVDERNANYQSVDGVLFNKDKTILIKYPGSKPELEYTIPDGVISIGSSKIVINGGELLRIDNWDAFSNSKNLRSITIPDSLTSMHGEAFSGCTNLVSIVVSDGNSGYSSVDGVLFNKDKTQLFRYPKNKASTDYVIPDSVTKIYGYAFKDCTNLKNLTINKSLTEISTSAFSSCTSLTSVTISEGVTSIGGEAFEWCDNLDSVVIPSSLTNISYRAFFNCNSLNYIYYCGLLDKWDEITIHKNGNDCLKQATISHICTYGDWVTDYEPTCMDNGMKCKKCVACGNKTDFTEIPARGHNYSAEWFIDKEATCTQEGSISHHCTVCGDKKDITVMPIKGHLYGGWVITKQPTCTSNGSKYRICTLCGYKSTEAIVVLGHNYSAEWTIDVVPTCTTKGQKSHHCTACDGKKDVTVIEATGHNYVTTVEPTHPHTTTVKCSFCDDERTETPYVSDCVECNFTVAALDANSYKLVSYIGTGENVVVPTEYNGLPITKIEANCFKGNTTIKSVVIPEGITSMGNAAFYGCTNLESVTLPSTLTSTGNAAFYNCTSLKSVKFADGVTTIGNSVFRGCTVLETITIPESVTTIGTQAFYGFIGTIYCTKDSVAHKYSVANNLNFAFINDMPVTEKEDTDIDYENRIIKTTVQSCTDITNILVVSDSARIVVNASCKQGGIELLGTGTVVSLYEDETHIGDYTLVVNGDTNGDSICDALDCFEVERAANGNTDLSGAYAMAADSNSDEVVDITDYQAVVNKALAS